MDNILKNPFADLYGNRDYLDQIKMRLGEVMQTDDAKLVLDFNDQLNFLEKELKPLATVAPLDAVGIGKELLEAGLRSQHYIMPPAGVTIETGHPILQTLNLFEDAKFLTAIINKSPLLISWNKADASYSFLPALFDNEIMGFLLLLVASTARDFWTLEERTRARLYQQRTQKVRRRQGTGKARTLQKEKGYIWLPRFQYDLSKYRTTKTVQHQIRVTLSPHLVSGHIRRLSDGHKASDQAIANAAEFGITVSGETTFVMPHERGEIEQLRNYRSRSALQYLFGENN